ncbi:MAG TPA: tetratricopeptide repeat protein [Ignavibacteria bacterium]|jgi:TolA-binding protein
MLKARRRIKHKELKQDKLVTSYFKARSWFDNPENRKKIGIGAAIVAVLILAFFLYTSNRKAKNEEAETKLSTILTLYQEGKYNEAINGDQAAGLTGLNEIVVNYGGTEAGQTAKFFLANCQYNLKDYDNALKNYDDYSGGNDIIKASCVSGMGAIYEAKGDLKKAAEYYEKAAKVSKELVTNQENLYHAVRVYSQLGDKENANRVYKQLKEDYPKSRYVNDAKRYEAEFKN